MDLNDPFDVPAKPIMSGGRYRLPNRDGSHRSGGWMRVTNLVSAYSDQYALRLWEIGATVQGMVMDPALYEKAREAGLPKMTRFERREWTAGFVELAKEASGDNAGAIHGNARHGSVEELHEGLGYAHQDADTRRALALYESALVRCKLQSMMQERIVLISALGVCGKFDNILLDAMTGKLHIGDLKTQKKFWTWLEIGAQLACYAHGEALWDAAAGTWVDMPAVDQEAGIVLWMPRKPEDPEEAEGWELRVEVKGVDLVKGWATARRAYEIVLDRAEAKSAKASRAWLWPAPPVTETERYAARFAAVESRAEGSRLVAEARSAGVWSEALAQSARRALERLEGTK